MIPENKYSFSSVYEQGLCTDPQSWPQCHSITVEQLNSYNIYKCYLDYLIVTLYVLPFVSQI